jgi:hypothetical protein
MAQTQASKDADAVFSAVLNPNEMETLRHQAEVCRANHGAATHLGANHYFEALVELGWPDDVATRLAKKV